MATKDALLIQAKALNEAKEYDAVIDLLKDEVLQKNKSAPLYAEVAEAYYRTKKYEQSVTAADNALAIESKNAKAHNYKGNWYCDQKQNDEAIQAFQKAIELDSNYANPYNGLGIVYKNQKKYDEAIQAYKKAIEIDSKFANPYNGLGNVYSDQNKNDEAIDVYKKAIELDPAFVHAYNGLGDLYRVLGNYDEAKQMLNKCLELDPTIDAPYYNLGILYEILEQYADALNNFLIYIERKRDNPSEFTKRASDSIKRIRDLLTDHEYERIKDTVKQIKEKLLHEDGEITHYTSLNTAKLLILEKSPLRLSEGAFLNDTSEGTALFKFFGIASTDTQPKDGESLELFAKRPFIGSYVPKDMNDELTLWRMYGKDDKEEAKGCSITLDAKDLVQAIKNKLIEEKRLGAKDDIDEDLQFYQVAYKKPGTSSDFTIPKAEEKEGELSQLMGELKDKVTAYYNVKATRPEGWSRVLEQINSIAYLFKFESYQHEQELRLVIRGLRFAKNIENKTTPPWVYIELAKVVPIIRKLTLGPKVDKKAEWASAFFYAIDNDPDRKNIPAPFEIYISHLPFK